jgi:hypothetical protein
MKLFEIEFLGSHQTVVTAELREDEAPISCENLWEAMAEPLRARLHHGRHCAAELWCYLPQPKEMIPYESSTVFPGPGDILYYYFVQPPTRQGRWVCDLGIFYSHGQSRALALRHRFSHSARLDRFRRRALARAGWEPGTWWLTAGRPQDTLDLCGRGHPWIGMSWHKRDISSTPPKRRSLRS